MHSNRADSLAPEIKRECIWAGPVFRPASVWVRNGPMIRAREGRSWGVLAQHTPTFDSLFDQVGSLRASPESPADGLCPTPRA